LNRVGKDCCLAVWCVVSAQVMPGMLGALSVAARLGQLDCGSQGVERAGLARRARAHDQACPEQAELAIRYIVRKYPIAPVALPLDGL
jgi:hypothetical protein